jgi:drug/metabolite transporter (DMT)-like permease
LNQNAIRAVMELVFAGVLWGFSFIAAEWVLEDMEPFTLTAVRFAFALLIGFPLVALLPTLRSSLKWEQAKLAIPPGLLLGAVLLLQVWGQRYTTATNSSFITTLYVLFVPLMERAVLGVKLHPSHFIFVVLGLFGTALICGFQGGEYNFGDVLTLICSVFAAVHILWYGLIQERIRNPLTFNIFQVLWSLLLVLPFTFLEKSALLPQTSKGWIGMFMLVVGSTLIAFTLQVRAQKILSPSVASFLYLLESPFATMFAFYFLGERLGWDQWVGGILILGSIAFSTYISTRIRAPLADVD